MDCPDWGSQQRPAEALFYHLRGGGDSLSSESLSLKEPDRTIPMLRGRSASDSVLPSGDAPYSSMEASCVGMLLERVIRGGAPTGLGTGRTTRRRRVKTQVHLSAAAWEFKRALPALFGTGIKMSTKKRRKKKKRHSRRLKNIKTLYLITAL